jgi:hypothetical protein
MKRPKPGSYVDEYRAWMSSDVQLSQEQLYRLEAYCDRYLEISDAQHRAMAIDAVVRAAVDLCRATASGIPKLQSTQGRRAAVREVTKLYETTASEQEFLNRLANCSEGVRRLFDSKRHQSPDAYAIFELGLSLDVKTARMLTSIRQELADGHLRSAAPMIAACLKSPASRGRPRLAANRMFVKHLGAVWVQFTGKPLREDPRGRFVAADAWPWRDWVGQAGKVVAPDFNPAGACRSVYQAVLAAMARGLPQGMQHPLEFYFVRLPGAPRVPEIDFFHGASQLLL